MTHMADAGGKASHPVNWDDLPGWHSSVCGRQSWADSNDEILEEVMSSFVKREDLASVEPKELVQLFEVTRGCLEHAVTSWDAAQDDVERLEKQYKDLASATAGIGDRDPSAAQRLRQAESELQRLESKLADRERELLESQQNEKSARARQLDAEADMKVHKRNAEDFESKLAALERDNNELRNNLQTKTMRVRELEGQDSAAKNSVTEQNKLLQRLHMDLDRMTAKCEELHTENDNAWAIIDEMKEKYETEVRELRDHVGATDDLQRRNVALDAEIGRLRQMNDELEAKVKALSDQDDKFMNVINDKMQSVKQVLIEKEREIRRKDEDLHLMQNKINLLEQELRDSSIEALRVEVNKRDEIIRDMEATLAEVHKDDTTRAQEEKKRAKAFEELKVKAAEAHKTEFEKLQVDLKTAMASLRDFQTENLDLKRDLENRTEEVVDANVRLREFESGEPQLPKAIEDIRRLKDQLQQRKTDSEDLVMKLNALQMDKDFLEEENNVYRKKYGPLNMQDIKQIGTAKDRELQKQVALIQQYREDIEELEEEVLELKAVLRLRAVEQGARAGELGLDPAEVVRDNNAVRKSKSMRTRGAYEQTAERGKVYDQLVGGGRTTVSASADSATLVNKVAELSGALAAAQADTNNAVADSQKVKSELEAMKAENAHLTDALSIKLDEVAAEINKVMPTPATTDASTAASPAVGVTPTRVTATPSRVSAMVHGRAAREGSINASHVQHPQLAKIIELWKGKIDFRAKLATKNDEMETLRQENKNLKHALKEEQFEVQRLTDSVDRKQKDISHLEKDIDSLRAKVRTHLAGGGGVVLPDGVTAEQLLLGRGSGYGDDAVEEVANLNEQLIGCLEDLNTKERELQNMERDLEKYRAQAEQLGEQKRLLYAERVNAEKAWTDETKALREKMRDLQTRAEQASVWETELESLKKTLRNNEEKSALVEANRKIIVLKVNEKDFIRRHNNMQEVEQYLRKENKRLETEMHEMDGVVKAELEYQRLQRKTDGQVMESLTKKLERSVPAEDLAVANRKLNSLTSRYHESMAREKEYILRASEARTLRIEVTQSKILAEDKAARVAELEAHNNHLVQAVAMLQKLQQPNSNKDIESKYKEIAAVHNSMATLTASETAARRQLEALHRRLATSQQNEAAFEKMAADLDQRVMEIARQNEELANKELKLADLLKGALPAEEAEAIRRQNEELEKRVAALHQDLQMKERLLELSNNQKESIKAQKNISELEVEGLQRALREQQQRDDDASALGRLSVDNMNLRLEQRRLATSEETLKREAWFQADQRRAAEKEADLRTSEIYKLRQDTLDRTRELTGTINSLRQEFSGAVTIEKMERSATSVRKLELEKSQVDQNLETLRGTHRQLQIEHDRVSILLHEKEDLVAALQDRGLADQKVLEWSKKVTALKIDELKTKRALEKYSESETALRKQVTRAEESLAAVERSNIEQATLYERSDAEWRQREVEWQRRYSEREREMEMMRLAVRKDVRDPAREAKPVSQLEDALKQLNAAQREVTEKNAQLEYLKQQNSKLATDLSTRERDIIDKNLAMNEMRRDLAAATGYRLAPGDDAGDEVARIKEVAQSTIQTLQTLLDNKDKTLNNMQNMLRTQREELAAAKDTALTEITLLKEQLAEAQDEHTARERVHVMEQRSAQALHAVQAANLVRAAQSAPTEAVVDAHEVEAVLAERTRALNQLVAQLQAAKEESGRMQQLAERRGEEIDGLRAQLQQQEQSQAPTHNLQRLVNQLKNQLALKEGKVRELQKAIKELNTEMMTVAVDGVKAKVAQSNATVEVQAMVETQTAQLQARLNEVMDRMGRMQREVAKLKTQNEEYKTKVAKQEEQLANRDSSSSQVNNEMRKLQQQVRAMTEREGKLQAEARSAREEGERAADARIVELERKIKVMQASKSRPVQTHAPAPAPAPEPVAAAAPRPSTAPASKPAAKKRPSTADEGSGSGSGDRQTRPGSARGTSNGGPAAGAAAASASAQAGEAAVARWEAEKRWQRRLETLKAKVTEQANEIAQKSEQLESARNQLARVERGKAAGRAAAGPSTNGASKKGVRSPGEAESLHAVQERLFAAEQEVARLTGVIATEKNTRISALEQDLKAAETRLAEQEGKSHRRRPQDIEVAEAEAKANAERERVASLERELLDRDNAVIELRFQLAQATETLPRYQKRVADLEQYAAALKAAAGAAASSIPDVDHRPITGAPSSKARTVLELEELVVGLKRAMEKLKTENETLKKGSVSYVKFVETTKENKQLKKQVADMEGDLAAWKTKEELMAKIEERITRVAEECERWRHKCRAEEKTTASLRAALAEAQAMQERLASEVEPLQRAVQAARHEVESGQRRTGMLLSDQASFDEREIDALRKQLAHAQEERVHALRQAEGARNALEEQEAEMNALRSLNGGGRNADTLANLQRENTSLRARLETVAADSNSMREQMEAADKARRQGVARATGQSEDLVAKAEQHDALVAENKRLVVDRAQFERLYKDAKEELDAFDPEFFNEIEDLKYSYKSVCEVNKEYERKLTLLSRQYGVAFTPLTTPNPKKKGKA